MNKVKEVMATAIQMEKDGIKYYSDASKKINNDVAGKMFSFLIEDEKRHIKKWKEISSRESIEGVGESEAKKTSENIKTIFTAIPDDVKDKLKASSEESRVLSGAIEMEEKGIKYYSEKSRELEGKAARLCRLIAREEKTHRDLLQNTLDYIKDNWQWNVEAEDWSFTG